MTDKDLLEQAGWSRWQAAPARLAECLAWAAEWATFGHRAEIRLDEVFDAFLAAAREGDFEALVTVLDVVLRADAVGEGALVKLPGVITAFGVAALTFMMGMYALERRHRRYVLGFACGCLLSSAYGFLAGAWPFGVVEALWGAIAINRYRGLSPEPSNNGTERADLKSR